MIDQGTPGSAPGEFQPECSIVRFSFNHCESKEQCSTNSPPADPELGWVSTS